MTAKEIKRWLNRAYFCDREIQRLKKEKKKAFDMATKVTTETSTEHRSSTDNSAERKMIEYSEYSQLIDKSVRSLLLVKKEVQCAVSKVEDVRLRNILSARYISFMKWDEIAEETNYNIRHIYRLHRKALEAVKKHIVF